MARLRPILKWTGIALLAVIIGLAVWIGPRTYDALYPSRVHETVAPAMPERFENLAVLVFSKTNGFRHEEAIPAANKLFAQMAADNGWGYYQTENGATFDPEILKRFDAVIFSNVSGDVFTTDQRAAFKAFLENGGGYVGIHAAGDSSHSAWGWYVDSIIGTNFTGHPMSPQFQKATVRFEDKEHPASKTMPTSWKRTDEWYSFDKSPRAPGINIVATLDESTYDPGSFFGTQLAMGKDHPIVWSRCVGRGRAFYSAMGHTAESYAEAENVMLLTGAIKWALKQEGPICDAPPILPGAKP